MKYTLTDEHRAQLGPWAQRWTANAMSTKAMDDADRKAVRVAIRGLYEAASLIPPPDHRIVFVPSPFVARFAAGFAAWIWYTRKQKKTASAATYAATDDATRAATYAATDDADQLQWYIVSGDMVACARKVGVGREGLLCARLAYERMWQGGNQWSGWSAFLSFFRHIVKLPLDYRSGWQHWEAACVHGGPRLVHHEFCIVSDRPERLLVDEQNQPHCDNGPFCRWRDGSALYAIHGVKLPAWIVDRPDQITVETIRAEANTEIRRIMRERYGEGRYLANTGATVIDTDLSSTHTRRTRAPQIMRALLQDSEGRRLLVGTDGSTSRTYHMEVPAEIATCRAAHEFLGGIDERKLIAQS